jgi:MFS family permease
MIVAVCRGPFSDRYGRRLTYNLSTVVFLGTTLGCIFSPNINVLIALRALQGFARE